jgi:hypothetical protein
MLRHAKIAFGYELEFPNPDTDTDKSSGDDCAPMVCEHDDFDEIHVDPLEHEIDVDYNCPEHNAFANVEPYVTCDDLELELGGRWLLGSD